MLYSLTVFVQRVITLSFLKQLVWINPSEVDEKLLLSLKFELHALIQVSNMFIYIQNSSREASLLNCHLESTLFVVCC
jgi:hypothetical protein